MYVCSLQELHLHNNHLSRLPDELMLLHRLFVIVLAFNRFTRLPLVVTRMTKAGVSELENIIFAGNEVHCHQLQGLSQYYLACLLNTAVNTRQLSIY